MINPGYAEGDWDFPAYDVEFIWRCAVVEWRCYGGDDVGEW